MISHYIHPETPSQDLQGLAGQTLSASKRRYLMRLQRYCQALPLVALGHEEEGHGEITLDQVYIELETMSPMALSVAERRYYRAELAPLERKLAELVAIAEREWEFEHGIEQKQIASELLRIERKLKYDHEENVGYLKQIVDKIPKDTHLWNTYRTSILAFSDDEVTYKFERYCLDEPHVLISFFKELLDRKQSFPNQHIMLSSTERVHLDKLKNHLQIIDDLSKRKHGLQVQRASRMSTTVDSAFSRTEKAYFDKLRKLLQQKYPDSSADLEMERVEDLDSLLKSDNNTKYITALEAAIYTPRLVILGDPGSGKSTFVRKFLALHASSQLNNIEILPTSTFQNLLPILITLRDLAPNLSQLNLDSLSGEKKGPALAKIVRNYIQTNLVAQWNAKEFLGEMLEALETGRCLLVLDGLDELPETVRRRTREAVWAMIDEYQIQRVIVTCRVRSYEGETVLPNFQVYRLAKFDTEKSSQFAYAWYTAQRELGRVTDEQAKRKATNLAEAGQSEALRELAANPMLLTTMAIIHQREVGLPKERVQLFKLAVDVLLKRWQQWKFDDSELTPHSALAALLSDMRRIRPIVEALAYSSLLSRKDNDTIGDLPREKALKLLEQDMYLGNIGLAAAFLDYVDQRAGLLIGKGGKIGQPLIYSFPHRSFQEYLAACHLVGQRDKARAIFSHIKDGDMWDLVIRLGAEELCYNRPRTYELLDLAYSLYPDVWASESHEAQRALLWSVQMATLAGRRTIERDHGSLKGGKPYLKGVLPRAIAILTHDPRTADQPHAGVKLSDLDNLRFRDDCWYLPYEALLGFVEIPDGPFIMGSDPAYDTHSCTDEQPQHKVDLPRYFIARYPVTVAQFCAFVEANGYQWEGKDKPQGEASHPVVYVNWYDAMEYCKWLTETLRNWSDTPEVLRRCLECGGYLTLPSEAEWEKAARGTDGRKYPWGNVLKSNQANYDNTGINMTNIVGCFPDSASPYGVEEMSGNVWEWTRSMYKNYPYPNDKEKRVVREEPLIPTDICVVRGGSFLTQTGMRCCSRGKHPLKSLHWGVGFRVAAVFL